MHSIVENNSVKIFSAIDFLSTFFSILKTRNINVVSSSKLFSVVGKYRDQFIGLFIDIDIIDNCGTVCSHDLEEGISMLQILGAISKANPRYERIILKMHKESANEMIQDCPEEYRTEIEAFTEVFINEINCK